MNSLESRANQLFADAIELGSAEEQTAFLDCECQDNQQLREAVEALLDSYRKMGSFLVQPAAELRAIPEDDRHIAKSAQSEMAHSMNESGKSVLNSLGEHLPAVPQVLLRDAKGDVEPITFPASKEIPQTSAKYQLLGEIARGGIGAILKGRDTDLGRDLAVKVLLDQHKDSPEVIHRFIEEAQIGGQLQHPGIAPVYELGQFDDRRPYFAMKLIKGETLSVLLAEREHPTDDRGKLLAIFEQISQTMAYAHSRGVIHRDLKPPNIMVGAFGEVQVMDWGLAKVLHSGGVADEKKAFVKQKEASVIRTSRSVGSDTPGDLGSETRMGSVLGTPAYMPPEQALGEIDNLDERSDVFGLGAILCEILTGLPPYVGENSGEILRLATRGKLGDCFARLDRCEADEELVEFSKRCLAHEPCDRPRDASELAEHVSSYLESVQTKLRQAELERASQTARVAEEKKRRRVSMALAASFILLLCVAGGGWAFVQRQHNERQLAATAIVTEALTKARVHQGLAANGELLEQLQEMEKASLLARQAFDLARKSEVDHALRLEARRMWESTTSTVERSSQQLDRLERDQNLKSALERIRGSKGANWARTDPSSVGTPICDGVSTGGHRSCKAWS